MTLPRISVALCTYNGAKYLKEQLDSMLIQTRPPNEVVACDDGSRDATLDILENFAKTAPFPVRIVRNEQNLRMTKNFEKCIGLCTGEFIALSDFDDAWYPRKLEVLAQNLSTNEEAGYVCSDADLMDENSEPLAGSLYSRAGFRFFPGTQFPSAVRLETLLNRNVVWGSAMMLRASLRRYALPFSAKGAQDYWTALVCTFIGRSGVAIEDRLWRYRVHPTQGFGVHPRPWKLLSHLRSVPIDVWQKEAEMFSELEKFIRTNPDLLGRCNDNDLLLLEEKIAHSMQRNSARRSSGMARWKTVFAEIRTGRYGRFSLSWKSAIRDLLL